MHKRRKTSLAQYVGRMHPRPAFGFDYKEKRKTPRPTKNFPKKSHQKKKAPPYKEKKT